MIVSSLFAFYDLMMYAMRVVDSCACILCFSSKSFAMISWIWNTNSTYVPVICLPVAVLFARMFELIPSNIVNRANHVMEIGEAENTSETQ